MLEYIERAKLRAAPQNYEGLAVALGVSKTSIYSYKSGDIYPTEDVMILLGIMADIQPGQAIIDLMNIKANAKSNEKLNRRVSIINEHLGIDDKQYKESNSLSNAIWNTR